jgi:lysophospholipase L1-like esterase
MSRRERLLNIGLSIAVLAVLCGIGEAAVRVWGPRPDAGNFHERLPGSPRRWRLTPGGKGVVGGEALAVNSFGMRDREYPLAKPPGVTRIAVLGDSYTFGNAVPLAKTFVKVLERDLNDAAGSARFEVMNFGVKGYDTSQELATLREVALPLDPDMILVAYFLNDVGDPERFGGEESPGAGDARANDPHVGDGHVGDARAGDAAPAEDGGARPAPSRVPARMRLRSFLASHSRLAGFLIHRIAIVVRSVASIPYQGVVDYNRPFVENGETWRASKAALREIKSIADSLEAPMMVVVIPEMGNFNESYPFGAAHDTLKAFCGEIGVPAEDLLDGFRGLEAKTLWASYDDPHFNARAHRLAAEQIERALRERGLVALQRGR